MMMSHPDPDVHTRGRAWSQMREQLLHISNNSVKNSTNAPITRDGFTVTKKRGEGVFESPDRVNIV